MTVRTGKQTSSNAYDEITSRAFALRALTETRIAQWSPAGTTYDNIGAYLSDLLSFYNDFNDQKSTPGLAQAAKDAEEDQTYEIVTEVNTLQALMIAVKDRILVDVPQDGSGWRQVVKFNADGSMAWRSFGSAPLANLLADMQAVVDQVDA